MVESNKVYENKIKINHWEDKLMEHKKIFYSAELKMYQLEMTLAKWDNSRKLRWSFRSCEIPSPVYHEERKPRMKPWMEMQEEPKKEEETELHSSSSQTRPRNWRVG